MLKIVAACLIIVITTISGAKLYVDKSRYSWMKQGMDMQYAAWNKWEAERRAKQAETLKIVQTDFMKQDAFFKEQKADDIRKMPIVSARLTKIEPKRVFTGSGAVITSSEDIHLGSDFSDAWNDINRILAK